MKKVILFGLLAMVLMGCSSAEEWPPIISDGNYTATKLDTPYDGNYSNVNLSYSSLTEEELVQRSLLIAKVEVFEGPVEYEIKYQVKEEESKKTMRAFQAKVLKVYYSDNDTKEGYYIKFLREEFWGKGDARNTTPQYIKLSTGTYILFLENFDSYKERDEFYSANFYTACESVAPYFCSDACRDIIECGGNDTYYFDQNFKSLRSDAKRSSPNKGFILYEKTDPDFDKSVQALVDKYKSN